MRLINANPFVTLTVGFSAKSYDPAFGQSGPDQSVKGKIISLIASVRMIMRGAFPSLPRPPGLGSFPQEQLSQRQCRRLFDFLRADVKSRAYSASDHHKHAHNSLRAYPWLKQQENVAASRSKRQARLSTAGGANKKVNGGRQGRSRRYWLGSGILSSKIHHTLIPMMILEGQGVRR